MFFVCELTDLPKRKEKWCIKRNSLGVFFGIKPKGEIHKDKRGHVGNGPTILSKFNSFGSLSLTASGFRSADRRLAQVDATCGPTKSSENRLESH